MVSASAEFRKSGFTDEEAANLSRIAAMYQNVADTAVSSEDAVASIVSQIRAYGIENDKAAEWATHVIDTYNEVANSFSVGTNDLSQAMEIASAGMATYGNSFEEVLGLVTSATEIMTGRSSQVARGLQTIASRIVKNADALEEYGIAVTNTDGSLKSTYEVLKELKPVWDELSDSERTALGEQLAGLNQYKVLASTLQNFETAIDATTTAYDSAGSAAKENAAYMESLEAHLTTLQSAWEAFSNSVVKSEFVKLFLSAGTGILKALNTDLGVLTTQFGLLWGVLTGGLTIGTKMVTNITKGIAAVKKFGITLKSIGLAAPIAAAAISALIVVIVGITSAVSTYSEYQAEVNKNAKELNDTFKESEETYKKNQDEIEGTTILLKNYTDRLDVLRKKLEDNNDATQLTAAEQIELKNIIETLNEKIPDLNLKIDETTGKLNLQTKEIYNQIDAWKQLSLTEAYKTSVASKKSAYESTQVELATLQATQKRLETERNTLLDLYGTDIINAQTGGITRGLFDWAYGIDIPVEARKRFQELSLELGKIDQSIEVTSKALEKNKQAYKDALSALQDYESEQEQANKKPTERTDSAYQRAKAKVGSLLPTGEDEGAFNYDLYLKIQKHNLNIGLITEKEYYSRLQAILNAFTDESIISTEKRWDAEEEIYKYQQKLTKEQQQAYEQAVRDAESAAKARAQAEKQAINDIKTSFTAWQDEQDYLLATGQMTESEYYDNLKAKNDELFKDKEEFQSQYWTNLEKIYTWEQQQIENQKKAKVAEFDEWLKAQDHALAMGEISEEEYYTELKEKNDEYFKDSIENLDKYWKNEESWYKWKKQQIEEIHEAAKAALEDEIEKEKQRLELKKTEAETRKAQLETQQDEIERLADYIQTVADAEIGKIDEKISALKDEADAITAKYKEQIDALEEQNQAIDDQITKQKLLEALAKAQQSKKYVFKDGRFQYVDDVDAIASAQEQLDEFNREQALQEKTKQLEKQRDLELEQNQLAQQALEDEKKRWEEYKQGWSNITNAYTEQQNALLAQQKLGIDVEKATWDERLSNLESFKNQYISLATQIKAAEAEIAGYDAQISAVGSAENQDAAIRRMMKENSEAWHQTSDASERERLHEMNEYLNSLLSNKGTYNAASGQWSNLSYTQSQPLSSSISSVGVMTPSVASSAVLGSSLINKGISGVKQALNQIFNMGNISLPNVSNAKQFVSELKNLALQAAYSRA